MGIISGSVSFRGRFGDHFRVGYHFGVGSISGAVQVTVCIGLLKSLVHQYARSIKTSLESKTYQTTEEKKVIGIKMFVKTNEKNNRRLTETCSVRNNLISFNCRTIVICMVIFSNK